MRNFLKNVFFVLPTALQRLALVTHEYSGAAKCLAKLRKEGLSVELKSQPRPSSNPKLRVLFYHVSGLSFGGTEKFLQILAKYLDKNRYEIYFMYSPRPRDISGNIALDGRKPYLENAGIKLIEFDYETMEPNYPYFVSKMSPSIFQVIKNKNIDLVVTASAGNTEFPFNLIRKIPIILINIFGSFSVQKNIVKNICISHTLSNRIRPIVPDEKIETMYIPSERPSIEYQTLGKNLRNSLGFKETDVVFGRIGRPVDGIFDSIGIEAFKRMVKKYPEAKYLIQSPPPILVKKVKEEKIPNVYFLEPTSLEEKIWAFHYAIDVMAHFRLDGESCGLNIIESMIAGRPIITHRSHIWNAHLEYLEPSFSRVADKDNVEQYATFIEEFILLKNEGRLEALGEAAQKKSEMFLIENNISRFEKWIEQSIVK